MVSGIDIAAEGRFLRILSGRRPVVRWSLPMCRVAQIKEPHGGQEQATRPRSISVVEPCRKSGSNI